MKTRKTSDGRRARILLLLGLAAAVTLAVIVGLGFALMALIRHCETRCIIRTTDTSVEIVAGKIVPAAVIANHFGLTNGANLAHIDFAERRQRLIADMPNIRDVKITRRLPDRVRIETLEREPIARLVTGPNDQNSNRVTDREGAVFWYPRNDTALLPVVREKPPRTPFGGRLTGLSAAALRVTEEAGGFPALKIQEADASSGVDYVLAVLGDSSRARLAWDGMSQDGTAARASLRKQLGRLEKAFASGVAKGTRLWNATDYGTPGRIYASDPSKTE